MKIQKNIPKKFQPNKILNPNSSEIVYPPNNEVPLEVQFYDNFIKHQPKTTLTYLPIFWTNYYIKNNYGDNDNGVLQKYLDSLDKRKKYFTIVQYADGILNDISNLNLTVFSAGGKGDIPIPLTNIVKFNKQFPKKWLGCFVGNSGTHPVRKKILNSNLKNLGRWCISDKFIKNEEYMKIMSESKYCLCPRGYGKTSFRINEAMSVGTIPIYISDDLWLPFFNEFEQGFTFGENEIDKIDEFLVNYDMEDPTKYDALVAKSDKIFNEFYTSDALYNKIIELA